MHTLKNSYPINDIYYHFDISKHAYTKIKNI